MSRRAEGFLYLCLYMLCIPAANWMILHVGTFCVPNGGPCMVPVAPGLVAPSGVVTVGLALVLRDLVQRRLGRWWSLAAIAAGAALSALLASPALVVASTAAFLLSELADFAVYTPLQRRRFIVAVIASTPPALSSTASCSCGSPSAASIFLPGRSSARPGWCCCPCLSSGGCASGTLGGRG